MTKPILLSLIAAAVCTSAPFAKADRVVRYIDDEPDSVVSTRRTTVVEEPVVEERHVIRRVEPIAERRIVRRVEPAPSRVITRTTRTTTVRESVPSDLDDDVGIDRDVEYRDHLDVDYPNAHVVPHRRIFHRFFRD